MINLLKGTVVALHTHSLTLMVNNIGFTLNTAHPTHYQCNHEYSFITYLHWHPEQGPTLYGFNQELDKELFILMIDCPGIGPKLALSILTQMDTPSLLEAINQQNASAFNDISGIGSKKAEQLLLHARSKVAKIIQQFPQQVGTSNQEWHTIGQVLKSLHYNQDEIASALAHLRQTPPQTFDQLLRSALTFLAQRA